MNAKSSCLYLLACLGVALGATSASATTYVLLTVDVESLQKGSPTSDIFGRIKGYEGEYGVPLMLKILKERNAAATFYLNVYETAKYGDRELKAIASEIVSNGQDLQLHTHPQPMYGKPGMSDFDLSKQIEIIEDGKKLIQSWSGTSVIAHRAGAYMGNTQTVRAVRAAGLVVDASLSPASDSPLSREGHLANDMTEVEGVLELPLTYFAQVEVGPWRSVRFLDIESSSLSEIKNVLRQMADKRACAINIMMHSFSFTRYGRPDEAVIQKLGLLLDFIGRSPDLRLVDTRTFVDLYRSKQLDCIAAPDFVPATGIVSTYLRSWERITDGWKNVAVALGVPMLALFALGLLMLLRKAKRSSRREEDRNG